MMNQKNNNNNKDNGNLLPKTPRIALTNTDLDDIRKEIEKDNDCKIEWVFSNDEEKEKDNPNRPFSYKDILTEEYIHLDSGRHDYNKPETWGNKWHYGVLKIQNLHPKRILLNAKVNFVYELGSPFEMRTQNMTFEAPPPKKKPTEYTVRKNSTKFIDRYFINKEAFEKFHYQKFAKQTIEDQRIKKTDPPKPFVVSEEMEIGNIPPNSERFLIFKCYGWSTRVSVRGDIQEPKRKNKAAIREVQAVE